MKRFLVATALILGLTASLSASHLLTAQYTTIRNAINADGALSPQPLNDTGYQVIADAMNVNASPDFWVWRTSVAQSEYVGAASVDATTWSWSEYIGRSQGERDAWRQLFASNSSGTVNPTLANVRAAVTDIFSGAGASPTAQRAHFLATSRRKARRWEKLLATGTGSTASPGVLAFAADGVTYAEGVLANSEVEQARNP